MKHQPLIWLTSVLIVMLAPWMFTQSSALSVLSQMGTMIIFGLSFNMLLGQTGMLSFGHAIYSGLAAFVTVHVMNKLGAVGVSSAWLLLMPLIGGMAGMVFGIVFGFITTRASGTALSMITLGLVELVAASALMFSVFFGGEGGVSTDRVFSTGAVGLFTGIDFGSQLQVYYLIVFWLILSVTLMYLLTKTPLARIANAVRDNPERAAFIGYDPRHVRYVILILSAFFAGVAGALGAINFEIASAENVSLLRSAQVLLFTYIGGIAFFFGPIIGAIVGVFFSVVLPAYTRLWQLYLGLLFMLMVLFAPNGMMGLLLRLFHRTRTKIRTFVNRRAQ
ncbi:branched-chain amino acid ABC transporter permease [Glaciimonas soli]|uniref:Branched-chain amino acid ABC transporter permease n=1 Tax=Glaciimonas soli TaxID=2590999 RepID=A0A843YRK6_9BURK|nr:branched-chain amino acid ABC transporter permease [Glaciimonas soli]MQQ99901.1 branched-chain amino acid ABC transporter permease [Glaciimonas soli]